MVIVSEKPLVVAGKWPKYDYRNWITNFLDGTDWYLVFMVVEANMHIFGPCLMVIKSLRSLRLF